MAIRRYKHVAEDHGDRYSTYKSVLHVDKNGPVVKFRDHEREVKALRDALTLMISPIEHLDGCLFKADRRMPCQCGFSDRINAALAQARAALKAQE